MGEDILSTGPQATKHRGKIEVDKWCRNAYIYPHPSVLYVNKFGLKVCSIWGDGALKTGQRISDWCFNGVTFEWVEYMQTAALSLMNSLGLFPAGRADAERRNSTCFSILLHYLFLPASNLILEIWGRRCLVGLGARGSEDDTLLTLLALILMTRARGLYTIHFNAISSCQEGWVIQWEHNCILKFLHWFIPGM